LRREYVSREWCEECKKVTPHRVTVVELTLPLQPLPFYIAVLVKCLKCGHVELLTPPREVVAGDQK